MLSSLSNVDKPVGAKKIKIHIRLKSCAPVTDPVPPRSYRKMDVFDLMQECRKKHIIIRGNKATLCRALEGKIYRHKDNYIPYIGSAYIRYFLYALGNGALAAQASNTDDFYTDRPISRIPNVYIYCINEADHVYAFDIRSINGYYKEIATTHRIMANPYTMQPLTEDQLAHLERKNAWLQKLGFHTMHLPPSQTLPLKKLTERYAVDVFHKISMYQYVSHTWFMTLTTRDLQKLYYELWDLWTYRLSLTGVEARKITKDGALFTNLSNVKKYTDHMKDTLRCELLKNIEKLVTEGKAEEDRKTGSLYFMLGFVQVSQDAADHHPSLFNAVYNT